MDNETSPADETVMARARADLARAREAMRKAVALQAGEANP